MIKVSGMGEMQKEKEESQYLNHLYENRFQKEMENRKGIWPVLCKHFFQQFIKEDATVVDIAAGYCDFINHIRATKKIAIDLNPDVRKYANSDVAVIQADIHELEAYLEQGSCDVIFMSNFLEHIPKESIKCLFEKISVFLRGGGVVVILTPNIKYVGGKYWDFFDHITPITESSLIEVLELCGLKIDRCIKKFIPYSTKSRLPQASWIVYLYLKLMPFSGYVFGEQSVIVARKE